MPICKPRRCTKGHPLHDKTAAGACKSCIRERRAARDATLKKYSKSKKAAATRLRWIINDPKRSWASYAVGRARMRAKKKGLPCDITRDFVLSITPDSCPIFGCTFVFYGGKVVGNESPTLDRLDPSKGYVEGNIAVISMKANTIKNAFGSADIAQVARWLEKFGL